MPVLEEKNVYLSDFERAEQVLAKVGPPALHRLRQAAVERFVALGFPTLHDEEWRFTNLAPLTRLAAQQEPRAFDEEELDRAVIRAGASSRLVFVNGRYTPELSSLSPLPPGTVVCSLAEALESHIAKVEPYLGRHADYEEHAFTALNTAFIRDGAFVYLPKGAVVLNPILLVFVSSTPGQALQNSIELARLVDGLGYRRFWMSEHHAMDTLACTAPEVMLARIGAETKRIRIGSGGIMLPH